MRKIRLLTAIGIIILSLIGGQAAQALVTTSPGCSLPDQGCTLEELAAGETITVDGVTMSNWSLDFVNYLGGVDLAEITIFGNDLLGPTLPEFDLLVDPTFPLDVDSTGGFGFFDYSFDISVAPGLKIFGMDLDRLISFASTGIYSIDIEAETAGVSVKIFDFNNGGGDFGFQPFDVDFFAPQSFLQVSNFLSLTAGSDPGDLAALDGFTQTFYVVMEPSGLALLSFGVVIIGFRSRLGNC